jgi:hypothetical protein
MLNPILGAVLQPVCDSLRPPQSHPRPSAEAHDLDQRASSNLTAEQRRKIIAAELNADATRSDRAIRALAEDDTALL